MSGKTKSEARALWRQRAEERRVATLTRRAERRWPRELGQSDGPSWAALATGLALFAVVGVVGVVVYLVARRPTSGTQGLASTPQVFLINASTGQVTSTAVALPQAIGPAASRAMRTPTNALMKTMRLPWLGDAGAQAQAAHVATSLQNPYEVTVRVVAPPGALAALSLDQGNLTNQALINPVMSTVPMTNGVIVIPAGSFQKILMNPRQALYGRGNMSPDNPYGPVVISVTATDNYDAQ